MADWDFSGYVLDSVRVDEYQMNWKTFVETYLEVYHVNPFHPAWATSPTARTSPSTTARSIRSSSSPPRPASRAPARRSTAVARGLHFLKQLDGRTPKYGALWASYYPGLTFEWYPNVLIVSNPIPRSPTHTTNVVEFYYPEEQRRSSASSSRRSRPTWRPCSRTTRFASGSTAAGARYYEQGLDDAGPYQSPMEDARCTSMNGSTPSRPLSWRRTAHRRVFDCRHDLARPALGEQQYRESHIPARCSRTSSATSGKKTGRNGRHPLPEPGEFEKWLEKTGLAPKDQVVRDAGERLDGRAPVVDAALDRPRQGRGARRRLRAMAEGRTADVGRGADLHALQLPDQAAQGNAVDVGRVSKNLGTFSCWTPALPRAIAASRSRSIPWPDAFPARRTASTATTRPPERSSPRRS